MTTDQKVYLTIRKDIRAKVLRRGTCQAIIVRLSKIHSADSFAPQAGLRCHRGNAYPTLAPPRTERGTALQVGLQSDSPSGLEG